MRKLRGPATTNGAPSAPVGAPPRTVAFLPVAPSPCNSDAQKQQPSFGLSPLASLGTSESRFYDVIKELAAEYDRSLAERRELKVENTRLLLEVEQLRSGDRNAGVCNTSPATSPPKSPSKGERPAIPELNGSGEVRLWLGGSVDTGKLLPPRPVAATLEVGLEKDAVEPEEAMRQHLLQGLPPEPQCPASPRPPPESPRGGAYDQRLRSKDASAFGFTSVVEAMQERASSKNSANNKDVELEDFGRPSNVSLFSQESRASCDSNEELEHHSLSNEELELLPFWMAVDTDAAALQKVGSMKERQSQSINKGYYSAGRLEGAGAARYIISHFIMSPSGRVAVTWDFFTIVVLMYDLVVIPLQAYPLPDWDFWAGMELLATVTWTCDIILSFVKGYEVRGNIEMRPWFIMRHYMRTWFFFDFSIVAMDWVLYVFKEGDLVDWLRFSRVRRALRLLRLARLLKHGQRFLAIFSIIQSENWLVIFRILWLLTVLVAINHFVSCGWYAIGTLGFDRAWGKAAFDEELHSFAYRYLTSFHWSVTQFTPASMEIVPTNELERVYNICIIFFGMLMFSCFVSSMTNSMTYLTKINYEKRQRQNIARSYIVAKGVPLELANDIMRHVVVNQSRKRGLRENDVGAFKDIPKRLIEQMRVEVHRGPLGGHALFGYIQREDPVAFSRICQLAMSERPLVAGEELFHLGTKGKGMFFIVNGSLSYTLGIGGDEGPPVDVGVRQWLSEACLWVVWEHKGRTVCQTSSCDITELDVAEFHTIVSRSGMYWDMHAYAKAWAKAAAMESGGAEHVTDFWGQRLRVSDLVQKTFKTDNENEAQRMVRIMGGGGLSVEFVFKAWVKFVAMEKEERKKTTPTETQKARRKASFVSTMGDGKRKRKKTMGQGNSEKGGGSSVSRILRRGPSNIGGGSEGTESEPASPT